MALKMCVPSETVVPSLRINLQEIVFYEDKNLYRMITMTLFIITKKKKRKPLECSVTGLKRCLCSREP